MLARLTKPSTTAAFDLVIPERPAAIAEANVALQQATVARQAEQHRHVEAGQQLAAQRLGEPITITQAEVEEIGAGLAPLFEAEEAAKTLRDDAMQAFQATIGPAVSPQLKAYRQAVSQTIADLEQLLKLGPEFKRKALLAGIDLNRIDRLPGFTPLLLERLDHLRKALDRAA
ncbi:hypothetical protein X743_14960 [Mesorhizobium sp. LNHC252B00]|uniref:hypothetical protein n=1 Tax=Mesorhizobium sp. LNHC252B00 TaxID=1287252 RepID=UPI0003CE17D8|nr:hypothetical protein [Mesorhizobium sp. LNHC252B00]ESY72803.1 hypothetical protein X743_14960 [Mesorhizobium sp. LNHC252B00]